MGKISKLLLIFIFFLILGSISSLGQEQVQKENTTQAGWSSVDDVFIKQEKDILVKKPMSGPIKIGFTVKEVQEVMGVPDHIDEEGYILFYRRSPIYFNHDWKVQSWDNRYGNLEVLKDVVKITLGSHILDVFRLRDFPIRIIKMHDHYQLEYSDDLIYIGKKWLVEAIQPKQTIDFHKERETMRLEDFLAEFYCCWALSNYISYGSD